MPLVAEHLEEAPYVGLLFLALILAAAPGSPSCWYAATPRPYGRPAAMLTLLAIAGFLASRTVGLPQLGDDVGNWTEPLGFPALAAETLATALAAVVLAHRPAHHHRKGTS